MKPLTKRQASDMPFPELLDAMHDAVRAYESPQGNESRAEEMQRLSRTIDELPDIYGWLLELKAHFGYWADRFSEDVGKMDPLTRSFRERRDAADDAARYASKRYDGASRLITVRLDLEKQSQVKRSR